MSDQPSFSSLPGSSLPGPPFGGRRPVEVMVVRPPSRRYWLHALLFLLTVMTTLVVGARMQHNFDLNLPFFGEDADFFPWLWAWQQPSRLLMGIPFSVTLLGILMAHEMGHFVECVRNRVYASLPYFIPGPTLAGTLGAFIRIRSSMRTRSVLFDIGIGGPIAGFAVAVPALAMALALSKPMPYGMGESAVRFGSPLIFRVTHGLLGWMGNSVHAHRPMDAIYLHPTAIAAWVGMFATALNLLPAGQLDGGHIVYALWPGAHRTVSRAVVAVLVPLGVVFWPGWLMWSVILLLTGMKHPLVAEEPGLNGSRKLVAVFGLLMLALTFLPAPFPGSSLVQLLRH